jgi:hypothetical protein
VHLTPDQKALVRQAIQTGDLQREEEAVKEAPRATYEERLPKRDGAPSDSSASLRKGWGIDLPGSLAALRR